MGGGHGGVGAVQPPLSLLRKGGIKCWSRQAQMANSAHEMGQDKSEQAE